MMNIQQQIDTYIHSQPEPKHSDMLTLYHLIRQLNPKARLWYLDGSNNEGKLVTHPNIGFGSYRIQYADGSSREFYQVGFTANTNGISLYIMGLKDKNHLVQNYADKIGKAKVTGYCIRFKILKEINADVLKDAINYGFEHSGL